MIEPASSIECPPQSTNWLALTALRDLCDRPGRELVLPENERAAFRKAHGGLPDVRTMKALGGILIRWATMGTGATKPSLARMAESLDLSERAIRRNLRGLERFGVIRLSFEAIAGKKRQPRTYSLIVGRQLPGKVIEARRKKRPEGPAVVKHVDTGAKSEAKHFARKVAEQKQFTTGRARPNLEQRNREAEAEINRRRADQQEKVRHLERLANMSPQEKIEAEAFMKTLGLTLDGQRFSQPMKKATSDGLTQLGEFIPPHAKSG